MKVIASAYFLVTNADTGFDLGRVGAVTAVR